MNFPEREREVLKFWDKENIFKKTLEKPAPKGSFVFYEGPPTANGKPGIHHAEARAFKDCIPRFKTMQGYRVVRKGGWDTHGLPVELEVEKQLGFTGKAQIEEYGIAKFNEKCRESVWAYKKDWEEFTQRLGYWVDLDNAYITYKPEYVESLWWVVKQIWDRGLLYKDYRVTPHCPRCGTSLSSHELSQGYKDVKDLSVTAKFKIVGTHNEYFLAWTTTPWTLPGNVALAVGKDITYVKVRKFVLDQGVEFVPDGANFPKASGHDEFYWLAKDRLAEVLKDGGEIVEEVKGEALVSKQYEPLYPFLQGVIARSVETKQSSDEKIASVGRGLPRNDTDTAYRVHPASFVTTQDGTGIVHTAVMYGADDFELGQQVGLPKHHLVNLDGTFVAGMDFLAGRFVADEEVAVDIIKDLAHRGLLFAKAKYEHSYPHCWRCGWTS
ncbi:MAG: class I tRNA ligase family protein, partial [Candidatus Uhrbacteria bacterium]|nr:class I tRNA ligase family protein [Candidatus Uhrbacteria bacterium]